MSRTAIMTWLRRFIEVRPEPTVDDLNAAVRQLAKWRSLVIVNTQIQHHGLTVVQGPFKGMEYVRDATEGAHAARLLGSYESELHGHIEAFAAGGLDCVIDVGCAEGYYAVGLARLMPQVTVHAYDIAASARTACAQLAAKNGVADRVRIGETFTPTDFEAFADRRCLVIMDVEGAEDDLLRPDLSPALARMSLIVETHDAACPGVLARLRSRFAATHLIETVVQQHKTTPLPPWMQQVGHLDQLLAVWEWRAAPTPWLVMRPRPSGPPRAELTASPSRKAGPQA